MVWIDPWARLPLKAQYTCKSSGCVLASVAEGWRAAPSALPSGPRLPTTLSVQTGHCSQSSFYFPAKSVLISVFFLPFSFMCVLLIKTQWKWASERGAIVFFDAWWPSEQRLNQTGAQDLFATLQEKVPQERGPALLLPQAFVLQPRVVVQQRWLWGPSCGSRCFSWASCGCCYWVTENYFLPPSRTTLFAA